MRSPKTKKHHQLLKILREHQDQNLPFVLYKKPRATIVMALLQTDSELEAGFDLKRQGFLMTPFHPDDAKQVFLRADQLYQTPYRGARLHLTPSLPAKDAVAREIHMELVSKSVEMLKAGTLKKVVVSRRFSVPAPSDRLESFFEMIRWYPDAFGYFWYHPGVGTWMGATPELFLRYHSGVAETISLAGTRPADPEEALPRWSSKEEHEQQLVTDFILDQMRELGLKPQQGEVRDVRAGKLWHLGTSIRTFLKQEMTPELLAAMHPTPAVCGLPREEAYAFIRRHENYNREYYTGFLGEVGLEEADSFEFFVNLRCVQYRNGDAYLYVGGGITPESDPEAEWEETQEKSTTMLSLLRNSS
ncbi:MAG: chorismate-binding protein [Robiginitalea sp.]